MASRLSHALVAGQYAHPPLCPVAPLAGGAAAAVLRRTLPGK